MFYAGDGEFVERAGAFVRAGVEAAEPVLVVVGARKIGLIEERAARSLAGLAAPCRRAAVWLAWRRPGRCGWDRFRDGLVRRDRDRLAMVVDLDRRPV
jgi:hypothetical protein